MRKKSFFILLVIGNMLTIEAQEKKENTTMNPFFQAYNTPFKVPPFDKIKNDVQDYVEIVEEGKVETI